MLRSSSSEDLAFDPEIDRTYHRRLRARRANFATFEAMEGHRGENNPPPAVDGIGNNPNQVTANENNPMQVARNDLHRPMCELFMPTVNGVAPSIAWPTIQANNFELKPALIQMVQVNPLGGGSSEDTHDHLTNFLQICAIIKSNGVSDDAIRLRLFPFSLKDKARSWLNSLPPHSLTN